MPNNRYLESGPLPLHYYLGEDNDYAPYTASANFAGNCANPIQAPKPITKGKLKGLAPMVRCKKCYQCRIQNMNEWQLRMQLEHLRSHRTWWITLTFNDKTLKPLRETHKDDPVALSDALIKLTQKYLKLLRYKAETPFKYIRVFEIGNGKRTPPGQKTARDGHPHFHLLIFEQDDKAKLTKRILNHTWNHNGYFYGRLVKDAGNDREIRYISKYMHKQKSDMQTTYKGYKFLPYHNSRDFGADHKHVRSNINFARKHNIQYKLPQTIQTMESSKQWQQNITLQQSSTDVPF